MKNTTKGFVALVALCAAGWGGYKFGENEPSSTTPLLQLNFPLLPLINKSMLLCPQAIPLNGKFNCSSEKARYWQGARIGEAVHSGKCLPACTDQPDIKKYSFKKPKEFVCEESSPDLEPLLEKMEKESVPYFFSRWAAVYGEKTFLYFTYDSKNFEVPDQNFTVSEIENDADAMAVIRLFFESAHPIFGCDKFVLWKGE